jgi:hypothetical protein
MNGLDDGWAVGGNGVLFHWNGLVWTAETAKVNPFDAYAIWGSGRDNVWVCGSGGTVIRYNGVSWVSVPLPAGVVITNGGLYDVSGSGPNDIWLVGTEAFKPIVLRWDGVNLVSMPAPPSASSVYASADGVYIAANNSGLYKFDGIAWNTVKVADASTVRGFGKELFIGGDNGLHTWNGSAWTQQFAGERFTTVYARGMGDAWAYGGPPTGNLSDQHLVHWNGISWVEFEKLPIWVKGIGSFGSKDLWVVGSSSGILHLRQ